jgi:hypothetical protein
MNTTLSHFPALLLFALVVSVAFAFMLKSTARERLRYAARALFYFVLVSLVAGWLMFIFQR